MKKTPKYRLHAASGQARVTINGRTYYLGRHDSKSSHDRYDQLIAQWLASGRSASFGRTDDDLTIVELVRDYATYCRGYYGIGHTSELHRVVAACKPLTSLYKALPASSFGPQQFKAVREAMIDLGWCRGTINKRCKTLARMFKWAAVEEMLPPSIYEILKLVPSLRRGKTTARESEAVMPVEEAVVDATCEYLTDVLADMVRAQMLIGCRPGEICRLTPKMIDRSGAVWVATLSEHKTAYCGKGRSLYIGPKAQAILMPYLLRDENECLFRPCDSEQARRAANAALRVTPDTEGNRRGYSKRTRQGSTPKKSPGTSWDSQSYAKAIKYACLRMHPIPEGASKEEAKLHRKRYCWSPNRLRHARGTMIRKQFGLEAAQVILGHSKASTTEIYAERDSEKAIAIQLKTG